MPLNQLLALPPRVPCPRPRLPRRRVLNGEKPARAILAVRFLYVLPFCLEKRTCRANKTNY
jgi:hypothetical protein